MNSMLLFCWAFSTFTICVSSKYLLVEVDSKQLGDHKMMETAESGPEKALLSNRSISDYEHIPEMIKNEPRMEMSKPEPNTNQENPLTACNGKNCGDTCCGPACGWLEYGKCNQEGTCMTWPYEPECKENVDAFQEAEVGKLCEGDLKPIETREDCKKAQSTTFYNSKYISMRGSGWDLPPGCVSDRVRPNVHYVYFNPGGKTISLDERVRPICRKIKETPERPECPKDFRILEKCNYPQNVECTSGQECCCGKCHPSMIAFCEGGKWMGYYTHACMVPSCGPSSKRPPSVKPKPAPKAKSGGLLLRSGPSPKRNPSFKEKPAPKSKPGVW